MTDFKRIKEDEVGTVGTKANLEKLAGEIADMNYTKFTEGDDYASLTKRYSQQGQKAMDDTIGKVAARTGGMASSYATAAGNQAYNEHMGKLEDVARAMYDDQRQEKIDNFGIYKSLYDQEYQESRDRESDTRYSEDRTSTMTADEKASLANELYYNANAYPTYTDYKTAFPGTLLTEADFKQVKSTATGNYREDNKGKLAAEEETKLNRLWQDAKVLWSTEKTLTDDMREALGLTPEMEAAYAMYYAPQIADPVLDMSGDEVLEKIQSGMINSSTLATYEQAYGESYVTTILRDGSYAAMNESNLKGMVNILNDLDRQKEADALFDAWYDYHGDENASGVLLKDRMFTASIDGGQNHGGGINRDAYVTDEAGNEYRLSELIGKLVTDGSFATRKEARTWIEENQASWGVNTSNKK